MKTREFNKEINSTLLRENLEKQFGTRVNLEKYDREQLEDIRNKFRTKIFQQENAAGINDLLANETYQKNKAMLELLNTRIKEMLGEDIKKLRDKMIALSEGKKDIKNVKKPQGTKISKQEKAKPKSKPDFLDLDKDGNKKEPMKQAAKQAKMKEAIKKDKKELEGNAFGKAVRDAKKDGIQPGEKIKVGGKEYSVKEAMKKKCCCSTKGEDSCPVHGMKEGFPTVADAKARHEKEKGTGNFDKKDVGTGTVYSRKGGTSGTEDPRRPAKSMKSKKTGQPFAEDKHGADCDCSECMQQESAFSKLEKKLSHQKGITNPAGLAAKIGRDKYGKEGMKKKAAAGRAKADESVSMNFKHNVRFVNESIQFLLKEDEEGKAKAITAAGDIVNDFTSWMQRVGQYQTKAIIELADNIRADFGAQEAETFKQTVAPALSATLEMLTQQREAISNAVAQLAGESMPENPMGMEPDMGAAGADAGMEPGSPDDMNPDMGAGDEFGASDAAAGGDEVAGRALRESREQRRARKLAEAHSIISKLSK
jgi:hypothetical protein